MGKYRLKRQRCVGTSYDLDRRFPDKISYNPLEEKQSRITNTDEFEIIELVAKCLSLETIALGRRSSPKEISSILESARQKWLNRRRAIH